MSSAARVAPDEPGHDHGSPSAPAISPRDTPAPVPPPPARPSQRDLRHHSRRSGQRRASEEQIVPAPVARQRSRAEDHRQRDARTEDQINTDRLIELATQWQARTSRAARQQVLPEWLADRDDGVGDDTLYERAVLRLLSEVVQLRRSFSARKGAMRGMVLVKHLVLLVLEKLCDIGLCAAFLWLRLYLYFGILAGILVFSGIAQALSAYSYTREGCLLYTSPSPRD